jgi:serpin B
MQGAVAENNAFAFSLYERAASEAHGGNFVSSPLSAWLALTMTYAGAQGETQTQMAKVLQLNPGTASPFDAANALSGALDGRAATAFASDQGSSPGTKPSQGDYQLQVVNSVWGEKAYPWASSFLDVLAKSYGTGIYLEDFEGNPSAAESAINDWVSTETSDKINNLLPAGAITDQTRIVLVNAIHLKMPWAQPFSTTNTASGTFTRGDGTSVTADFMSEAIETTYAETDDAQVVTVPLAGNELSVVLALPKKGLSELTSSLSPTSWAAMTAGGVAGVNLSLPKFTFTTPTFSLANALIGLGMTDAFDPAKANFQGLCGTTPDGEKIYIGDVLQKATMAFAEKGVEAAAATAVIGLGSAEPQKQVTISFDKPFVAAIVDSSGAILFLAQIDDPTATGDGT